MKPRRRASISHRHKLLFGAVGAMALVLLGISVGFGILLSGGFSTAATTQHFALTHRLLDLGLRISVNVRANDIAVPSLDNEPMQQRGMACYRQHCEQCHGAPALAPQPEGRGMLPIPANLAASTREWSPAALYYITKKGVRMTGMPAWEFRMSDDSIWSTIAFLKVLPTHTKSSYEQMLESTSAIDCPQNTTSPEIKSSGFDLSAFVADDRGDVLLRQYACHSCHRIRGVTGPNTYVGPALTQWPQRKYIAGTLPNTHENLAKWIENPQDVNPQTLMPDLDVPPTHAREMANYLLAKP
jgi:mono/diheme cytochrome c family protein